MMCSNSYRNHYIKVGQHPKCVVSSIERAGQPLVKQTVSSAEICNDACGAVASYNKKNQNITIKYETDDDAGDALDAENRDFTLFSAPCAQSIEDFLQNPTLRANC